MDTPELQECRVLRIEPGDIVVFEVNGSLTAEEARNIRARIEDRLAKAGHEGIPVMVISGHVVKTHVVADASAN